LRAIDYIFDNSMVFIGPNLPHPIMYFVWLLAKLDYS
jgi:hypothetical protein